MKNCIAIIFFIPFCALSQPNCNAYKLNKDEACYKACLEATEAERYQGGSLSQRKFDRAIELCPSFDFAYFEKAVPYLKNGDFITWRKLIDKAVELSPPAYLGYRGWCRFQFLRDYKGAIDDLEKLDSLKRGVIGICINGDYHLNVAKALCYKQLGDKTKAISILERQLKQEGYSPMAYDYLHLGILKLETGNTDEAIECLNKQLVLNDYLADTYYYLGMSYKAKSLWNEFRENLEKANTFYLKGYKRLDFYTHPVDKIYLADIERELNESKLYR